MTEYAMREKPMSRTEAMMRNAIEMGRDILYRSDELMTSGTLVDAYTAELAGLPDCVAGYYYCAPYAFRLAAMQKLPRISVKQMMFDLVKEAAEQDAAAALPVMREKTRPEALLYFHKDRYVEQKAKWVKNNIGMIAKKG